jgi:L-ascorbate metabolism protein UlaG (beta-lactamase superfamily)
MKEETKMEVRWFGQSAFQLRGSGCTVFIDPFSDLSALSERGLAFNYPPLEDVEADLVLVTHEHIDHNGVEAVGGEPAVLRPCVGRFESPLGEVVAIASEHDQKAGTERGANSIYCFSLDGVRVCHFGDFGQRELRPEQREAIGKVDLLFLPVGGGPTIGAPQALEIVEQLQPKWVVPMHYRTPRIDFLEGPEAFLAGCDGVINLPHATFALSELPDRASCVVPACP